MDELNNKILEAIKLIASQPGYIMSYEVKPMSEKKTFFNEGSNRVLISIELTKN